MAPNPGNGYPDNLPQAGGKEITIDHDVLKDVANKLRADLKELKNLPPQNAIQDHSPGEAAIGNYSAGEGLYMTVSSAKNHISSTFEQFIAAYEQVINAIDRSEQNIRTADDNAAATARARGRVD
jgi:hypothetical protein